MGSKTKKILIIALTVLLVGLIGAMGAIFGKEDWNKVKDKISDIAQEDVVDNNLLLNSDFSKNTSGVVVYDETITVGTYIVDNWKFYASTTEGLDFVLSQTGSGLYINNSSRGFSITQSIANGASKYADKDLTLTFSVNDIVYSATFNIGIDETFTLESADNINAMVGMYITTDSCSLYLQVKDVTEVVINWIQLEEGTVFTGYNG